MERYRRGVHGGTANTDKTDFKTRLVRQSIICGIIFLAVLAISLLKTTTAQKLTEHIGNGLSYTVNYKSVVEDIAARVRGLGEAK